MTTRPIACAASPRFDWKTAMFTGGGANGEARDLFPDEGCGTFGSSAPAVSSSAPDSPPTSWTRVPLLGRRSLSPPHRRHSEGSSPTADRASWEDAGGENAGWARDATLTDPCFHHPRSSLSRNVTVTIDEDAADQLSLPVDAVTGNRRRPHRGAAPAVVFADAVPKGQDAPMVFFLDEDHPEEDHDCQPEPEAEPEPELEPVVRLPLGVLPVAVKHGRPGSPVFTPEARWQTAA